MDRTTPALVRFKPTGSDYSAVEKDFIVAYYLPGPMQVRLRMREQCSLWAVMHVNSFVAFIAYMKSLFKAEQLLRRYFVDVRT